MENPHPAIRMFALCETFKWTLPVGGGIYAQDPELLDWWMVILAKRAEHEKAERDKRERTTKSKSPSPARSPRARPRRR